LHGWKVLHGREAFQAVQVEGIGGLGAKDRLAVVAGSRGKAD
jgi:hypothetical protein